MSMREVDTGLQALAAAAKKLEIPVDIHQLERAYILEPGRVSDATLLRAAQDLGLKARLRRGIRRESLASVPLPFLARGAAGDWHCVAAREQAALLPDFDGTVILLTRRYELEQEKQRFGLRWFLPVLRKYGGLLRNVFLLSLLIQGAGLAAPLFMQVIIDQVLVHRSVGTLDVLLAGMLMIALFQHWMRGLRSYLFTDITSCMDAILGSNLYQAVTRLPRRYFDRWMVGDITARMGELENLRTFLTGSSLTIVLDILFAILYFAVLLFYSPVLTAIAAVFLLLLALLNGVAAPVYQRFLNERFQLGAKRRAFLVETLTGIQEVKSSAVEKSVVSRYEEMLARYVQSVFSVVKLANAASSISLFLQQAFTLAILWVGAVYVMQTRLTVGQLIAFQMIAGQLVAPVMRLVDAWQYFQRVRVSMARLGDILNEEQEPAFNPNRTTLPAIEGHIRFEHVSFSYRKGSQQGVQDIDLDIPAGSMVGIVGESGSGKSTLTRLIQRLYVPDRGRVWIDGVDLAQVDPAWLRRQIGVVLQDAMLFQGTIGENIRIAMPNATAAEVEEAARLAGADEFICEMPDGYQTMVGERGSLLSGGQRQRIAIARALLTDPRILIFDEATSALDYLSEKKIRDNLPVIAKGRTVLMIAHRMSMVKHADFLVTLQGGRVIKRPQDGRVG